MKPNTLSKREMKRKLKEREELEEDKRLTQKERSKIHRERKKVYYI